MENDYTYIGFICINEEGKPILIDKIEDKYKVNAVISSTLQNNAGINESEALICAVKYFDGTESVTSKYAHSVEYEDITIVIENEGVLFNDGESTIYDMVYGDFDDLNFFWGLLEEYFETDEGMKRFEEFVKKDNWK